MRLLLSSARCCWDYSEGRHQFTALGLSTGEASPLRCFHFGAQADTITLRGDRHQASREPSKRRPVTSDPGPSRAPRDEERITASQGSGWGDPQQPSSHLHLSNSPADTAIRPQAWCGRRGRPVVLFLSPPPMRGGGAPRAPCHGFRRGGPGVTGRPRARGLTHPCADASATP